MKNSFLITNKFRFTKEKPKGKKNKIRNKAFIEICRFEKTELKKYLASELKKYYKNVISKDGFLYVKGKDKIALTAHMDTTPSVEYGKRKLVKDVYEYIENGNHVVHSPEGIGGDDRCGIYMIMEILKRTDLRPSIIFCEDEEIGCVGSSKFTNSKFIEDLKEMYFIIELDRHGNNDLVYYDDENEEFHDYVAEVTGYVENWGSCSDISNICPKCGVAGVNISCGYHDEHHDYETVVLEEMERTLQTTIKLIKDGVERKERFEYIERKYYRNTNIWGKTTLYDNYFNTYKKNYEYEDYSWVKNIKKEEKYYMWIEFDNGYGESGEEEYEEDSYAELWYQFFNNHPNVVMENVTDWQIWTDKDILSSVE